MRDIIALIQAVPDHMLEGMSHLEHLDLSFNDVVKVNMSTFEAEAVQKSLTYLDLRYNEKLSQVMDSFLIVCNL